MPYLFQKYYPMRSIVFIIGEALLIVISLLAVNCYFDGFFVSYPHFWKNVQQVLLVTIVFQTCLYLFDLYDLSNDISIAETANKITLAFGVGCIILGIVYFTLPSVIISTKVFWTGYLVIFITILTWRGAYYLILRRKLFAQSVIIVGTGQLASDVTRVIEAKHDSCYVIHAFVGDVDPEYNPDGIKVYKKLEDVFLSEKSKNINRIVVALDDRRGTMPTESLLKYRLTGIRIEHGVSFYERATGRILVKWLDPSGIIFSEGFELRRAHSWIKRVIDIVAACVILVVGFPVILLTSLLIKLDSPGTVFYIQERVGQANSVFRLIKFRSMKENAEKEGAVWAKEDDDRITRLGSFIRKTRIDELPQMWNVFKGEMSLVGPRPERPVFVDQLSKTIPYYSIRHNVKPGITGWAQVWYPYGASEKDALEKLEFDLYYMKNFSIAMDLVIILKTIKTVLFQKGAR